MFHQSDRRFIQDCSKCGRSHVIRRCPDFFRKCSKCGAIGHFAVKCHTKQVQEMLVVREEQETQVVEEEEQPRLFVGMVETEKQHSRGLLNWKHMEDRSVTNWILDPRLMFCPGMCMIV